MRSTRACLKVSVLFLLTAALGCGGGAKASKVEGIVTLDGAPIEGASVQFYPAGEDPIPGITGETLYQAIKRKGHLEVQFIPDKNDIVAHLVGELKRGDMALTLGAGDIYKIGEELLEALK